MNKSSPKLVWLDTDIGTDIDDALTLSYLLARPDIDLLGVSTVTVSAVERAKLAAAICRDLGQENLRIFAGADRPLVVEPRQTEHPQTAAVDAVTAAAVAEQIATTGAHVEAMYRAALRWPGEVHLLAVGPLTNLALLVCTHPDVVDLLAGVTLMAGRYLQTARHEWNVWCDPHAAAIVFDSFRNVRAVGLDVTLQTTRPGEEIAKVWQPAGPTVTRAIDIFLRQQKREKICLHDPLAAACLVDETILEFETGVVKVETAGTVAEGVTVFTPQADGPHRVARTIHLKRFCEHYETTLPGCEAIRQPLQK